MLYPLLFEPYLKHVIWGGHRLCSFKGIASSVADIGESWEIYGMPGHASSVSNGPLAGRDLVSLIACYGDRLLGRKGLLASKGGDFPLLFKFIDAAADLSVQVHPDDNLARRLHGEGMRGKTELWYVIDAAPGAVLYSGLTRPLSPEEFDAGVADGSIVDLLTRHEVKAGDVFFLPAGRIHAIGAGCFIAEIQQSSDLTYRIYDYNRRDADGKLRELHTESAKLAVDGKCNAGGYRMNCGQNTDWVSLSDCAFFHTDFRHVKAPLHIDLQARESFTVLMCTAGAAELRSDNASPVVLRQGQSVLLPASIRAVESVPLTAEGVSLLETFIP